MSASARTRPAVISLEALVKLQHRHERLLGDLDGADPLHSSFAFLLPLQQFAFPGHVSAIAFGKHVLSHGRERFTRDELTPARGLARDLVLLAGDDRLQLLHKPTALSLGLAAVREQ